MVSIVIPVYNAASTIIRALDSIKNQTYNDFEIIIVNDGSTDDSIDVIEKYRIGNPQFKMTIISKQNGGVSSARNEGLKIAKGEYLAFLDADDEWLPYKLERQLQILMNSPSVDFLAAMIIEPDSRYKNKIKIINLKDLIFKNYFQPSTVIMKKEVYQNVGGFNESQRFAEEGNYFMRVASKFKCALLCEKLIVYGDGKKGFGERGLSANLREMEKGELMNLKFAYDNEFVNWPVFMIARSYSLLKYLRRILIVKMRKI
jgi:glycosyltransferase involved in cell wall biosynthesis